MSDMTETNDWLFGACGMHQPVYPIAPEPKSFNEVPDGAVRGRCYYVYGNVIQLC